MEWSRNQVLRLVELYHSQPALWDTSDPRFKDRQAKRWSLMTIASQMSLPPIDIEKKIHCLRTQFNREYLKMKTSARRPTWFAYQPLTFVLRNKHDVPEDISQWKPGTITVKEEFLDEYDTDDVEMRLTIDENPVGVNFVLKDDDNNNDDNIIIEDNNSNNAIANNSNINTVNNTNNSNNNKDNQDVVSSDNEIETSSAVEVILREPNDEVSHQSSQHQNKRLCRSNNNPVSGNNEFLSSIHNYLNKNPGFHQLQQQQRYNNNSNINNSNNNSNLYTNSDELAMFGRLLTDELLKVNDYYTLQLAKYEISKIIFKATTGVYDNTNTTDHYSGGDNMWKNDKIAVRDDDKKMSVSSLNELKTFSTVVINELRTISNNYSLQVAKFHINQVIFHATTAGIAPSAPLQSTKLSNDNSSSSSSSSSSSVNNVTSGY